MSRTQLTLKVFHLFCPEDNDRLLFDHMRGHMSVYSDGGKNTVLNVLGLTEFVHVCVCVGACGSVFYFSFVCEGEAEMRSLPETSCSFMISSAVFYGYIYLTFLSVYSPEIPRPP